ncbi:MAG: hypothetical protein HQL12_00325 [Candidatus Omnitrophica bacterium]|nr:hypothetical protein [Candidatus Omnitrophota bacterium]
MQKNILLLGLSVLVLAGCATSTSYVNYTNQHFPPKDQFYAVKVYPASQSLGASNPYYVIGRISIEGFASNGVSPETLTGQAKEIARKRGADAIINSKTEVFRYYGGDVLLRFKGELIVYSSVLIK